MTWGFQSLWERKAVADKAQCRVDSRRRRELGLGGGELGFQAVAEGHQLIHFGDDAVLLGEGGQRDGVGGYGDPVEVTQQERGDAGRMKLPARRWQGLGGNGFGIWDWRFQWWGRFLRPVR